MLPTILEMSASGLTGIPDPQALRTEIGKRTVELGLLRRLLKLSEDRSTLTDRLPIRTPVTPTPSAAND